MEIEILEKLLNWGVILVGGFLIIIIINRTFSDYYYEDDPLTIPKGMIGIMLVFGGLMPIHFFMKGEIDEIKERNKLKIDMISENGGVIVDKEKTSYWYGNVKKIVVSVKNKDIDTLFYKTVDNKTFYSINKGDSIQVKKGKIIKK